MTADHLFPVLDSEGDSALLAEVGSIMSQGEIPDAVMEGIRLGRLTPLQKPHGGVSGIVVGDIMRRLVARTMAKQIAKKVEKATAPFQYALTTKAGCECVAHILQTIMDKDERATVVSIDGAGAYDLISRNAMMEGLLRMEDGDQVHSCGVSVEARRPTCGKMKWASRRTSHKGREGNKETPSCHCCSHWGFIER